MSGGQDEASERINTSDLPYWLAGPIKRRELFVVLTQGILGESVRACFGSETEAKEFASRMECRRVIRVIAAPSEAEIEEAVRDLMFYTGLRSDTDKARVKTAIRKLLGGGE